MFDELLGLGARIEEVHPPSVDRVVGILDEEKRSPTWELIPTEYQMGIERPILDENVSARWVHCDGVSDAIDRIEMFLSDVLAIDGIDGFRFWNPVGQCVGNDRCHQPEYEESWDPTLDPGTPNSNRRDREAEQDGDHGRAQIMVSRGMPMVEVVTPYGNDSVAAKQDPSICEKLVSTFA